MSPEIIVALLYAGGIIFIAVLFSAFPPTTRGLNSNSESRNPKAIIRLIETDHGLELHSNTFFLDASDEDLKTMMRLMVQHGIEKMTYDPSLQEGDEKPKLHLVK